MTNIDDLVTAIKKQDEILMGILNDARIPSYIRQVYADMYNELHIKITENEVID